MPRVQAVQTSFADGQISPRMQGYVDLPSYKNSLKTCSNFFPLPQGSLARRPGTFFVSRTKDNAQVRLVPFNFGQGQSYILEFGNLHVRFYRTDAVLTEDVATISSVDTTTNTLTLSTSSHGLSTGDDVYLTLGTGAAAPGGITTDQRYFVHYVSGADIRLTLADNTLGNALNLSSAGSGTRTIVQPVEETTPYSTSDLDDLFFTQSADVVFIAHPNHAPRELKRTGDTTWVFSTLDLKDGPYLPVNTEDTTLKVTFTTAGSIGTFTDSDVDTSDNTITITAHGLTDDQLVRLTTTGALPTGLSTGTDYYVVGSTIDTIQLAASMGGSAINITAASGGGTHTLSFKNFGHSQVGVIPKDDIAVATDTFTLANHPLVNGQQIFVIGTDSSPGLSGITLDEDNLYYVVSATINTFKVSNSLNGDPIDISGGTLAGDFKIYRKFIPKNSIVTIVASSIVGINDDTGFQSGDNGRQLRMNLEVAPQIQWGYVDLAAPSNTTTITGTVRNPLAFENTTAEFQLGSFSTQSGFPRTIQIYQQRLVLGGTESEPQTVHFSKTGDFDNFQASEPLGVQTGNFDTSGASIMGEQIYSDNAISLLISSDTVDKIEWMAEGRRLTIGTSGGIFQMYGSRDDVTITPFSFTAEKISNWAAHDKALPAKIGNNMVYVQKNGRKVRELIFDREQDEYSAKDITLRAEDVTQSGIKEMVFQDQPGSILYCVRTDGKVASCTYIVDLQMQSWAIHTIGGTQTDATNGNHAKVESAAVIPRETSDRGSFDQLWLVVKRDVDEFLCDFANTDITAATDLFTINGHGLADGTEVKITTTGTMPSNLVSGTTYFVRDSTTNTFKLAATSGGSAIDIDQGSGTHTLFKKDVTQRYVEFMEVFYDNSLNQSLAHYIDCGSTYSGSSATSLTGLHYIEGETVTVLGNNSVQPDRTVLAGSITPQLAVTSAKIGFAYDSDIQTLPLAVGNIEFSTSIGNKKRIHRIVAKVLDSMGLQFGIAEDDLTEDVFRTAGDAVGTALPFFTGDRELAMSSIYDTEGKIYIRQNQPYPLNLLMLAIDYETNE